VLANPTVRLMSVGAFEAAINRVCTGFRVRAGRRDGTTKGAVASVDACGFLVLHVACSVMGVQRPPEGVRRDDSRHYFLIHQEEGRALMQQDGSAHRLREGDMMLIDSARPSDFTFFDSYERQLVVHLPRQEIHERFGPDVRGGLFFAAEDPLTVALRAVLAKGLLVTPPHSERLGLRDVVFGLVGAAAIERQGDDLRVRSDVSTADHLARSLAFVDAHFMQHDLSTSDVAAAVNLSARQLQRAFTALGMTPTQYLLEKRLEHAAKLLLHDETRENSTIARIALDSGFNDVSYFNRKFREAFDTTPSEFRARPRRDRAC
jgi:AraC family transcriptional regulator, positive regulator of tynA and feaB